MSIRTLLYLLATFFLWIFTLLGIYYITNISGLDQLLTTKLQVSKEQAEWIRKFMSFCFSIFLVSPTFVLMAGYLRGEIKIYSLLVDLSKIFSKNEPMMQHWKMLLKLVILRLLGHQQYKFKTSVPNYVHLHTAGAIIAREKWVSIYQAPIEYWAYLSSFHKQYVKEVRVLPNNSKKRYIISDRKDIEEGIKDAFLKKIFVDSLETGANTWVVYSDSTEFSKITSKVRDFSAFDDLVMVYLPVDETKELEKSLNKVKSLLTPERKTEELKKIKLYVVVETNTDYPISQTPDFKEILNGCDLLDELGENVRKKLALDQTTSSPILR